MKSYLYFICTCLLTAPLLAQNPRVQIQNLEKLSAAAAEVVDITLDGATLKMATRFLGKDKETQNLVAGLQGIYVKSFEFEKPGCYSKADLDAILAQLQSPAWNRIVGVVNRKDGDVGIYVMGDPASGGIRGLVVLAAEAKELTVVNIVGSIDLDKLGSLEGKFGIPKLSDGKEARKGGRHEGKK